MSTFLDNPGDAGDYVSTPSTAILNIPDTAFYMEFTDLSFPDMTPVGNQTYIVAKIDGGQWSWSIVLKTDGDVAFECFNDANSFLGGPRSTVSLDGIATVDVPFDLRLIHEGSGTYKYWYRLPGGSWTQLGSTLTSQPVTTHNDATSEVRLFSQQQGPNYDQGTMGRFRLWDDATATNLILDIDMLNLPLATTSFTESSPSAATVTLNGNARILGSYTAVPDRSSGGLVVAKRHRRRIRI